MSGKETSRPDPEKFVAEQVSSSLMEKKVEKKEFPGVRLGWVGVLTDGRIGEKGGCWSPAGLGKNRREYQLGHVAAGKMGGEKKRAGRDSRKRVCLRRLGSGRR